MSSVKKTKKKPKKKHPDRESSYEGDLNDSVNSSKGGSKSKKKPYEKSNLAEEKNNERVDNFFKLYKNKNDKIIIPDILTKLDLWEMKGCELLKKKIEKKKEQLIKNKLPLELDSREFKSLFSFDIFDDLDYNYIFDKIGLQEFDSRYISYNQVKDVNDVLSVGLTKEEMVLMFNHTDIYNQQIPMKKLKEMIIDWRRKVEDENVLETD